MFHSVREVASINCFCFYAMLVFSMRKKKKDDDEIRLFLCSVSQLPCTYMYFCELLGGINHSACLLWDFAASLAIILLVLQTVKSKYPN